MHELRSDERATRKKVTEIVGYTRDGDSSVSPRGILFYADYGAARRDWDSESHKPSVAACTHRFIAFAPHTWYARRCRL